MSDSECHSVFSSVCGFSFPPHPQFAKAVKNFGLISAKVAVIKALCLFVFFCTLFYYLFFNISCIGIALFSKMCAERKKANNKGVCSRTHFYTCTKTNVYGCVQRKKMCAKIFFVVFLIKLLFNLRICLRHF